jgi:ribosome biogenesis protein BRX1
LLQEPHWQIVKQLLTNTFAVPRTSRRVKPFIDHVTSFSLLDGKVWLRNYQITTTEGLVEIGPRLVLDPIRMFDGAFGGSTLWQNESYVTPNELRRAAKAKLASKYKNAKSQQYERQEYAKANPMPVDPLEDTFK